jgi:site-specific DNA recombinase
VRDRRIQLPHSWVSRLIEELDAEIVERQAVASERRVVLTKTLTKLADERGKLLQAFYGNAIPLDLSKTEQDRIGIAEHAAKDELQPREGDFEGWQDVLRTAIRLAGNCHAAYMKARPSVRRRFNDAVLEASTSRIARSAGPSSLRSLRPSSFARVRIRG